MNSLPAVSLVILTYRSAEYIGQCLESLCCLEGLNEFEIIVADNASSDGSAQIARECAERLGVNVRVMELPRNLGCAGGNNAGWRASTGKVVVFLNPDTEVTPTFVRELVKPISDDPKVGVTGAKIYYPGTTCLQHAGGFIHPNGMTGHYGAGENDDQGNYDTVRKCDYVTGAGVAVRRSLLEQLGGFDEEYFPAYFEEVDFCTRARRAGVSVLYIPTAVLYHHESVTLAVDSPGFRRLYQKMRIVYLWKNLRGYREWRAAIGFEKWWMMQSPYAKGHRLEQFRAYIEGTLQMGINRISGRSSR